MNLNRVTDKHNCVDEKTLTGYSPDRIKSTSQTFTARGALRYSVTAPGESGKTKTFTVNGSETSPPPLRVPRPTEKQNLSAGDPIDPAEPVFAGHEQDRIGINLRIGKSNERRRIRKHRGSAPKIGGRPAWMVIQADNTERAPHEGSRRLRNPASRPLQETVTWPKQAPPRTLSLSRRLTSFGTLPGPQINRAGGA